MALSAASANSSSTPSSSATAPDPRWPRRFSLAACVEPVEQLLAVMRANGFSQRERVAFLTGLAVSAGLES